MPLTMKQILRYTPGDRIERADNVRVLSLRFALNKTTGIPTAVAQTHSVEKKDGVSKAYKYVTKIAFMPKRAVKMQCSCPDFLYRWEVALHKYGAADITFSNGMKPEVRNPGMVPGTCKHCVALYNILNAKNLLGG